MHSLCFWNDEEQMLTLARMGYDVHGFDHESLGRSEDR
jgi:hypothetical protein